MASVSSTSEKDNSLIYFRTNGTNVVISEEWVLPIPVANPHTLVSFTFQTSNGDISFSMVFIGLNGEEQIIIPPDRVNSDSEPFNDSVRLPERGSLILMWDNSYSWWHKKELSYSLQIEQDPDFDANGRPKIVPLSTMEDRRIAAATNKRTELLQRIDQLKHRLSSIDEVLKSVTSSEIDELELSIIRIRKEIEVKRNILKTSRTEKKEVVHLLRNYDRFRAPLNIRTLSGKNLAHALSYLHPADCSLVCKYWCQLTAYNLEKSENPELSDDDFEILFDYEMGKIPHAAEKNVVEAAPNVDDLVRTSTNGSQVTDTQSQLSDVPGSLSTTALSAKPVSSISESGSEDGVDTKKETTHADTRASRVHSPAIEKQPKKLSLAGYPDDVKNYLRSSLAAMTRMEEEKATLKARIDQWKINFERRHHRPPSDQEKLTNISTFYQKYSELKRGIRAEEAKIFKIANAIDKLESS